MIDDTSQPSATAPPKLQWEEWTSAGIIDWNSTSFHFRQVKSRYFVSTLASLHTAHDAWEMTLRVDVMWWEIIGLNTYLLPRLYIVGNKQIRKSNWLPWSSNSKLSGACLVVKFMRPVKEYRDHKVAISSNTVRWLYEALVIAQNVSVVSDILDVPYLDDQTVKTRLLSA